MKKFLDIFDRNFSCTIVDIGAMDYENKLPNYSSLLYNDQYRVIGFEPNISEYKKLIEKHKNDSKYTYYNYAIGDGSSKTFYHLKMPSCSSIFPPNIELFNNFFTFPDWLEIVKRDEIKTYRLDDILVNEDVDFLKIDVQGSELQVLENSTKVLKNVMVAEVEVEFLPQYQGQPLFSEIELYMRSQGFIFHTFTGYGTRSIKPVLRSNDESRGFRQWIWSDAIFIKNIFDDNIKNPEKHYKLAFILHDLYKSYDFAHFSLKKYDLYSKQKISDFYLDNISMYLKDY